MDKVILAANQNDLIDLGRLSFYQIHLVNVKRLARKKGKSKAKA
jgi:hypothetical protein